MGEGWLSPGGPEEVGRLLAIARRRVVEKGLTLQCGFVKVWPGRYKDAMQQAGFIDLSVISRNGWYRETAKKELVQMKGPLFEAAAEKLGRAFVDHNIEIWSKMLPVLETGEHCPSHLRARKPDGK